jgi:hypothetical protein
MDRKTALHTIDVTFHAIDRVIGATTGSLADTSAEHRRARMSQGQRLQALWHQLQEVCLEQEKEHRAFMRRSDARLKRKRVPLVKAAAYFAAVAVCRDRPEIRTWFTACDIRRDWALGYAIGEALDDLALWSDVIRAGGLVQAIHEVDYAEVLCE